MDNLGEIVGSIVGLTSEYGNFPVYGFFVLVIFSLMLWKSDDVYIKRGGMFLFSLLIFVTFGLFSMEEYRKKNLPEPIEILPIISEGNTTDIEKEAKKVVEKYYLEEMVSKDPMSFIDFFHFPLKEYFAKLDASKTHVLNNRNKYFKNFPEREYKFKIDDFKIISSEGTKITIEINFDFEIKNSKEEKRLGKSSHLITLEKFNNKFLITHMKSNKGCYFPLIGSYKIKENALDKYNILLNQSIPVNIYKTINSKNKEVYAVSLGGFLSKNQAVENQNIAVEKAITVTLKKVSNCTTKDWILIQ